MEDEKIILLLVSGVSGAGKTTVAGACESNGFYVVEDLPLKMFSSLLTLFKSERGLYSKAAVFLGLKQIGAAIEIARKDPAFDVRAVGLDCSREVLLSRYKLTRHIHPLQPKGYTLVEALSDDENAMQAVRESFDVFIDTTSLTEKELRVRADVLMNGANAGKLSVIFCSFGYKYGIPQDADVVVDARVLANPYWVPSLRALTGKDLEIAEYIGKDPKTKPFLDSLITMLSHFFKLCSEEGRNFVYVDCGCSGGQHRSVYIAEQLANAFREEYLTSVFHRELLRYTADEKD